MAKALNLGFTAWAPLSNGMLTGKYHGHGGHECQGTSEPGRVSSDMLEGSMPEQERTDQVVTVVKTVCRTTWGAAWRRRRWRGFAIAPCG